MGRFENKVVVVTGGSQGIGEACVRAFALEGANVVFCSPAFHSKEGKNLEDELNSDSPRKCHYEICDVSKESDVKNLMEVAVNIYGKIDCLLNNAGILGAAKPSDEISLKEFQEVLDVNLIGYFLTSKYALPHLRKTKGSIVNICSITRHVGKTNSVPYVASKGAVHGMTICMAVEEAKNGVRVNCISPGNIWTPLWQSFADSVPDPEKEIEFAKGCQVMRRFGMPAEIAQSCLFLAAEGTFCTGTELMVTGGVELGIGNKIVLQGDM